MRKKLWEGIGILALAAFLLIPGGAGLRNVQASCTWGPEGSVYVSSGDFWEVNYDNPEKYDLNYFGGNQEAYNKFVKNLAEYRAQFNDSGSDTGRGTGSSVVNDTIPDSVVPVLNTTAEEVAVTTQMSTVNKAAGLQGNEYLNVEFSGAVSESTVKAANDAAAAAGVRTAMVYDISLQAMSENGAPLRGVSNLSSAITFTLTVPETVDGSKYDVAMLRIHNGQAAILPDLDDDPSTVTFATDKFSVYALVYGDKGSFKASAAAQSGKDNVPKTGDVLPIAIPASVTVLLAIAAVVLGRKQIFRKRSK